MQCTISFTSVEEVKQTVAELVEARSSHLSALRTVLIKELQKLERAELVNSTDAAAVADYCKDPNTFNLKSDVNYEPLKPCGDIWT